MIVLLGGNAFLFASSRLTQVQASCPSDFSHNSQFKSHLITLILDVGLFDVIIIIMIMLIIINIKKCDNCKLFMTPWGVEAQLDKHSTRI